MNKTDKSILSTTNQMIKLMESKKGDHPVWEKHLKELQEFKKQLSKMS